MKLALDMKRSGGGNAHQPWPKRASETMEAAYAGEDNLFDFSRHWAYALMGTCVAFVSLLAVSFYVVLKRRRKAGSPGEPGRVPVKAASVELPRLPPGAPVRLESGLVQGLGGLVETPRPAALGGMVLSQPVQRVKAKGLLERRGSNASLTIPTGPPEPGTSADPAIFQGGSPPKECSAVEYLSSAGSRLTRRQLRAATQDPKVLHHEFIQVPLNHVGKLHIPGCGNKNRYRSIWPNPHSMVRLPLRSDPSSFYINANYIRGYDGEERAFIATQGPLSNTVNDFWRMVWEERSPAIVMMTKLMEKGRVKCEDYLPTNTREAADYGSLHVMVLSTTNREGYSVKDLIMQKENELRHVKHFWFTGWPDGRAPVSTALQLLQMANEVNAERTRERQIGKARGPVVVHCSAGIGRTGCFIGTYIGMWQLREENMVDILGIVCQMRLDRGGMIQTPEQYEFLHHVLGLWEGGLPDSPKPSALHSSSDSTSPLDTSEPPSSLPTHSIVTSSVHPSSIVPDSLPSLPSLPSSSSRDQSPPEPMSS